MNSPTDGYGPFSKEQETSGAVAGHIGVGLVILVLSLVLVCLVHKGVKESSLAKPSKEEARVMGEWDKASQASAQREAMQRGGIGQ